MSQRSMRKLSDMSDRERQRAEQFLASPDQNDTSPVKAIYIWPLVREPLREMGA